MRTHAEAMESHSAEVDAAEEVLGAAAEAAVKQFLQRVRTFVGLSLTAAGTEQPPDGADATQFNLWWTEAVDANLLAQMTEIWKSGYHAQTSVASGLSALPAWLASAKNRLTFTTSEDAWDLARSIIARGLATGAGHERMARELAAAFDWDHDAKAWRSIKDETDAQLDAILDTFGSPGAPAREQAKSLPSVAPIYEWRAYAQRRIDATESTWRARATRISRTEAGGALNAGAYAAYAALGIQQIEWLNTKGPTADRTRISHREEPEGCGGQVRLVGHPFSVGGFPMFFPGDPAGPPQEVINCRCTIVATVDQPAPRATLPTEHNGVTMPWAVTAGSPSFASESDDPKVDDVEGCDCWACTGKPAPKAPGFTYTNPTESWRMR